MDDSIILMRAKALLKICFAVLGTVLLAALFGCSEVNEPQVSTGRIHDNDGVYSTVKAEINKLYIEVTGEGEIPFNLVTGSDRIRGEKPGYTVLLLDEAAKENNEAPFYGRIQIKGNDGYIDNFRSFKVSLDDEGEFMGQRVLLLYKCPEDPIKITMKLGMDLFSLYDDVISTRTEFVRLYVKDNSKNDSGYIDYGMYTLAENPGGRYLRTHGLDRNGMLYEIKNFDFSYESYMNASAEERERMLELKNGTDTEKLVKMLKALEEAEDQAGFLRSFDRYFNEDNYLTFLAGCLLMGDDRPALRDFMLYSPTDSEKWYFMPMPKDRLFIEEAEAKWSTPPKSFLGAGLLTESRLHSRYFEAAENRDKLAEKSAHLMEVLNPEKIGVLLIRYKEILAEFLNDGQGGELMIYSVAETESRINGIYEKMEENLRQMEENHRLPMPFDISEPERNDSGLSLSWTEAAQGAVYHVEISEDFRGDELLFSADTEETEISLPEELIGSLYVTVTAENDAGIQPANSCERYLESVKWGMRKFVFTEVDQ